MSERRAPSKAESRDNRTIVHGRVEIGTLSRRNAPYRQSRLVSLSLGGRLESPQRFKVSFLNVTLISEKSRAYALLSQISLSLRSLDSISVGLETLITSCVVLLFHHAERYVTFRRSRKSVTNRASESGPVSCAFVRGHRLRKRKFSLVK